MSAGLIPAHAGKTSRRFSAETSWPAHPRSRGENASFRGRRRLSRGSSPLTRGKHSRRRAQLFDSGLIPAHAGKTPACKSRGSHVWAHPRSRGENLPIMVSVPASGGSSPLTRGKPRARLILTTRRRLIPAHAGKTRLRISRTCLHRAHPRSRGENQGQIGVTWDISGSSPLTRGKPPGSSPLTRGKRLIPAHAGKTLPDLRFYCADRSDLGNP